MDQWSITCLCQNHRLHNAYCMTFKTLDERPQVWGWGTNQLPSLRSQIFNSGGELSTDSPKPLVQASLAEQCSFKIWHKVGDARNQHLYVSIWHHCNFLNSCHIIIDIINLTPRGVHNYAWLRLVGLSFVELWEGAKLYTLEVEVIFFSQMVSFDIHSHLG